MAKFEKDYDAAAAQVDATRSRARPRGWTSTPTLFFNDRQYDGPIAVKYIEAVGRGRAGGESMSRCSRPTAMRSLFALFALAALATTALGR